MKLEVDAPRARPIAELLADHRARRPRVEALPPPVFEGVAGKDVYNPTAPFAIDGRTVLAARVESPDKESDSEVVFFEERDGAWRPVDGAPRLPLQDPAVARVGGEIVLAGVSVWGEEGALSYKTVFYRGASLAALRSFAEGPSGMKDIRVAALRDGRIFVLTRPQGARGGRGKIGWTTLGTLDALTPDVLDAAPILDRQFAEGEWGGANEITVLDESVLGVLGHVARWGDDGQRHYHPMVFTIDLAAGRVSPMHILFERADLPEGTRGPAKRDDLRDVLFSGGLVRGGPDGTATVWVGAGDKVVRAVRIDDPFVRAPAAST